MLARSRLQSRALGSVAEPVPDRVFASALGVRVSAAAAPDDGAGRAPAGAVRRGAGAHAGRAAAGMPHHVRACRCWCRPLPAGISRATRCCCCGACSMHTSGLPIGETSIFWYYTPMAMASARRTEADLVVYDNMDELSRFRRASRSCGDCEAALLTRADLVLTGGMSLYEAKRHRIQRALLPTSIESTHFAEGAPRCAEAAPRPLISRPGHPRLGYFGVIDERMDVELVGGRRRCGHEWQFVMIGPVVKIDRRNVPRAGNIHWLGGKSYAELPHYLAGWDVGLMPFAINEATRFITPDQDARIPGGRRAGGLDADHRRGASLWREGPGGDRRDAARMRARPHRGAAGPTAGGLAARVDRHPRRRLMGQDLGRACAALMDAGPANGGERAPRTSCTHLRRRAIRGVDDVRLADRRRRLCRQRARGATRDTSATKACSSSTAATISAATPTTATTEAGILDPPVRAAHLPHELEADLRLPLAVHRMAALRAPGAGRGRRHARADPDQPRHGQQALRPRPHLRGTGGLVQGARGAGREDPDLGGRGRLRGRPGTVREVLPRLHPQAMGPRSVRARQVGDGARPHPHQSGRPLFRRRVPVHAEARLHAHVREDARPSEHRRDDRRPSISDVKDVVPHRRLIYTGPIDEYFDFRFGKLPYRSLRFEHVTLDKAWHQPVARGELSADRRPTPASPNTST